MLADGTFFEGTGFGAVTSAIGEVCFNTAMTGYQEILSDPSYAGQIINFTFPHIGNVGTNPEDVETTTPAARGLIIRADITTPSNWRSAQHLDVWLKNHGQVGISGLDTRKLTRLIRDQGAPNGVVAHDPDGKFDLDALKAKAAAWPGLTGMDLALDVSCRQENPRVHVVAVDYGAKRNILRCLAAAGCRVTVVPATSGAEDILRHKPDGVFLSNGPGDPAATGKYAVPAIKGILDSGVPLFGICLGHQMLALALGGRTEKMARGHRGANHPVKDLATGRVEITSQNHGFMVVPESLPAEVEVSHVSVFDGSNEGIRLKDKPVFSVQYHPEASPGPQDAHYLFERFTSLMAARR